MATRPSSSATWRTPAQALALFFRGVTVRAAWKTALIVGTILSVVNQGSVIADGRATWVTWARVMVNYATPFVVCSIGFLAARHETDAHDQASSGSRSLTSRRAHG